MTASAARITIIGVKSATASLAFYQDVIGLRSEFDVLWEGSSFENYWHLSRGATARAVMLSSNGRPCGRVLLLEFEGAGQQNMVHPDGERWFTGYNNVNFYTLDIRAATRQLIKRGYRFWSDPLFYEIGAHEGAPTEVIFDGPDGVFVNLVEPQGDPKTNVGHIRELLNQRGCTPTGYSEVVTSSLSVQSTERALAFFVDALGLKVWMDFQVSGKERNGFLSLPPDCLSRNVFVVGDDLFGKIALFEPLNFSIPDRGSKAVAPNIGYLAMSFEVSDLDAVVRGCQAADVEVYTPPVELTVPGLGVRRAMLVRAPSCHSLVEVVQRPA